MAQSARPALQELTRRRVPGLAAVVLRDGRVAEACGAGVADLASRAAMSADTVQLWFSMTKIVTATAVMQLVEDGALGLDDPVRDFVPGFPEPRPAWPEVRVRHLLSHASGLSNPIPVRWVHPEGEPARDPSEFTRELLERHGKLGFRAGSKATYSNLGYLVLGEVIAAASGGTFEDHVKARILAPLGMSRTGFSYADMEDVATGYQPRLHPMTPLFRIMLPKGIVGEAKGRFVAFRRFYVDGPAYGGLVGSSADAARFMAAHLNHGEAGTHQLLSPAGIDAMQGIQARGRKLDVGFGWYRRGRERRAASHLEHLGGGGGFWTMMRIYPDRRLGIVTMGNVTGYDHGLIAAAVTSAELQRGHPEDG